MSVGKTELSFINSQLIHNIIKYLWYMVNVGNLVSFKVLNVLIFVKI